MLKFELESGNVIQFEKVTNADNDIFTEFGKILVKF